MKPRVIRKQVVYGSDYVEGFETLCQRHAIIHELAHKNRQAFENRIITSGRFSEGSPRIAGAVDRAIEDAIWFAVHLNNDTPTDYFGIDYTAQK